MPVTAVVIPEGLEPLAAWDARDSSWAFGPYAERAGWVKQHLGDPRYVYRAEFYVHDTGFAVVHSYARNADGRKHDRPDGKIATEPPVIVPLAELPPERLLRVP